MNERLEVETDDGFILRGELYEARDGPRAAALLTHAMWVDRRTLDRPRGEGLASVLARRGVSCLVFDLRGHGESRPWPREGARFGYDAYVRFDAPALLRYARRRFPTLPLAHVGHSLGAHTALIASGLYPEVCPDGFVCLGANQWLPQLEPNLGRRLTKGAILAGWAAFTFPRGHFDAKPLKLGSSGVPWPYVRETLGHYLTGRYGSADGALDYLEALGRVRVPLLSVSSEGDRLMANPEASAAYARLVGSRDRSLRIIRRCELSPPPDHMGLVIDPRMRPIFEECADFILGLRTTHEPPQGSTGGGRAGGARRE